MSNKHPEVPPTQENCEQDFKDKLKLNAEFEQFKKTVEQAAKVSPDVQKLMVPLKKLEEAIIFCAHGKHFVVKPK
jgi:hypothetical protein